MDDPTRSVNARKAWMLALAAVAVLGVIAALVALAWTPTVASSTFPPSEECDRGISMWVWAASSESEPGLGRYGGGEQPADRAWQKGCFEALEIIQRATVGGLGASGLALVGLIAMRRRRLVQS